MPNEKPEFLIRSALIPVFYQQFRCLMQDCQDNCCEQDWNITFSKKDYLRLRRLDAPPALRERLDQAVRRVKSERRDDAYHYAQFDLKSNGGRCPLLSEEGLCSLQRACGHDVLPYVCTSFPRDVSYTPAAKEYSLSPACEGVLQLLWDLPEGVDFVEDPLPKAEQRIAAFPQGATMPLYFAPIRGAFIDILQNRAISLSERVLYLGLMVQRLQKADWENINLDGWMEQAALLAGSDAAAQLDIPSNHDMYIEQNLHLLDKIAPPKESWPGEIYRAVGAKQGSFLNSGENIPVARIARDKIDFSKEAYAGALARFQTAFSDHEYFFENLMVALALFLAFPNLNGKEDLWKSYLTLSSLYSFYRFVSVLGCKDEVTKERLFHILVMVSRATVHSPGHIKTFQKLMLQYDSSTLAHMAFLLRWD